MGWPRPVQREAAASPSPQWGRSVAAIPRRSGRRAPGSSRTGLADRGRRSATRRRQPTPRARRRGPRQPPPRWSTASSPPPAGRSTARRQRPAPGATPPHAVAGARGRSTGWSCLHRTEARPATTAVTSLNSHDRFAAHPWWDRGPGRDRHPHDRRQARRPAPAQRRGSARGLGTGGGEAARQGQDDGARAHRGAARRGLVRGDRTSWPGTDRWPSGWRRSGPTATGS